MAAQHSVDYVHRNSRYRSDAGHDPGPASRYSRAVGHRSRGAYAVLEACRAREHSLQLLHSHHEVWRDGRGYLPHPCADPLTGNEDRGRWCMGLATAPRQDFRVLHTRARMRLTESETRGASTAVVVVFTTLVTRESVVAPLRPQRIQAEQCAARHRFRMSVRRGIIPLPGSARDRLGRALRAPPLTSSPRRMWVPRPSSREDGMTSRALNAYHSIERDAGQRLARNLGWFSIGLGVARVSGALDNKRSRTEIRRGSSTSFRWVS